MLFVVDPPQRHGESRSLDREIRFQIIWKNSMKITTAFFVTFITFMSSLAQGPQSERQQFIRVEAPVIALTHVRIIDGTGAAPRDDQTVVIADGKIQWVGPATDAKVPPNARLLDLKDYTVLPGLVGMHDHMF